MVHTIIIKHHYIRFVAVINSELRASSRTTYYKTVLQIKKTGILNSSSIYLFLIYLFILVRIIYIWPATCNLQPAPAPATCNLQPATCKLHPPLPKHRSTLGRQSIDMLVACRSRIDRVTIDISADASVDVSVEVRYTIHDPNFHPGYRVLGRKSRDLGNRPSPVSHMNASRFLRREAWRSEISDSEPAGLTGVTWRGPI